MSQSLEAGFQPSSPHSSSDVPDSFKGTPDTRLTAFSPEEGSAKSSKLFRTIALTGPQTSGVKLPANGHRGSQTDKDPFVTSAPSGRSGQKLSPTASSFHPGFGIDPGNPLYLVLASPGGLSTDLGLSRHLIVTSPTQAITIGEVDNYLLTLAQIGLHHYGKRHIVTKAGCVYVTFSDIRDASNAVSHPYVAGRDWEIKYVPSAEASKLSEDNMMGQDAQVNVIAVIMSSGQTDPVRAPVTVHRFLQSFGQLFAFIRLSGFEDGPMRAIVEFCDSAAASALVAELGNGSVIEGVHISASLAKNEFQQAWVVPAYAPDATRAPNPGNEIAAAFNGLSLSGRQAAPGPGSLAVLATPGRNCQPMGVQLQHSFAMFPMICQPPFTPGLSYIINQGMHHGAGGVATPARIPIMGPVFAQSPMQLHVPEEYSTSRTVGFGRGDIRRHNAARIPRSPHYNSSNHHNHVDIGRIRDGIDVRTTIMLRNIPNKVDQAMLKRIVDDSSWGKYDFMYLRIDFANDCNVGYAFINFVDPLDIIDFVNARGNQRWNCFKSDKVAEISYATIQGKDCLVQKFRNSSVMLEAPHYRPKLYFTSNGPLPELAGQEEAFPSPDNQSKMKRSCENAEHVGLFTPNAGQHFRDEQRRRRSQYDRGTRLAALEEYDYESTIQDIYPTQ